MATYNADTTELDSFQKEANGALAKDARDSQATGKAMSEFIDSSSSQLSGGWWSSLKAKWQGLSLKNGEKEELSAELSTAIGKANDLIKNYVQPDVSLDTAQLPQLYADRATYTSQIAELTAKINAGHWEDVDTDEDGHADSRKWVYEYPESDRQLFQKTIDTELQPKLEETNRLIEKIIGLEKVINDAQKILDGVYDKIREYNLSIDGLFSDENASYLAEYIDNTGKKDDTSVWSLLGKTGASVANGAISLLGGIAGVGENILDAAYIAKSISSTPFRALGDILKGDWSFTGTKDAWERTRAFVATDYVGMAKDWFYDTSAGQALDEAAFDRYKSDGAGCQFLGSVGRVVGIAGVTALTGGMVNPAVVAGVAGLGQYTQNEWNNNSATILGAEGTQVGSIHLSYADVKEIQGLQPGEVFSTDNYAISVNQHDGNYVLVSNTGECYTIDNINVSSTAGGLVRGTLRAGVDAAMWAAGGKIFNGQYTGLANALGTTGSPLGEMATRSLGRAISNAGIAALNVPVQSAIDATADNVTIGEAFANRGGVDAMWKNAQNAAKFTFGIEALRPSNWAVVNQSVAGATAPGPAQPQINVNLGEPTQPAGLLPPHGGLVPVGEQALSTGVGGFIQQAASNVASNAGGGFASNLASNLGAGTTYLANQYAESVYNEENNTKIDDATPPVVPPTKTTDDIVKPPADNKPPTDETPPPPGNVPPGGGSGGDGGGNPYARPQQKKKEEEEETKPPEEEKKEPEPKPQPTNYVPTSSGAEKTEIINNYYDDTIINNVIHNYEEACCDVCEDTTSIVETETKNNKGLYTALAGTAVAAAAVAGGILYYNKQKEQDYEDDEDEI